MKCIKITLQGNSTETTTMESLLSSKSNLSLCPQMFSLKIKSSQTSKQLFSRITKIRKREYQVNMILARYPHLRNNQRLQILPKRIKNIAKWIKQVMFKTKKLCKRFNKLLINKSKRINNSTIAIIKDKLKKNNLVELSLRRHIVSMIRLQER